MNVVIMMYLMPFPCSPGFLLTLCAFLPVRQSKLFNQDIEAKHGRMVGRMIKHQEEWLKHAKCTYLNRLRMIPRLQNIWLSLLKYVKIRRTLVQLKQSKKIKLLSECNFPYFTLERKYQLDKSSFHLKTAHNFFCSLSLYIFVLLGVYHQMSWLLCVVS